MAPFELAEPSTCRGPSLGSLLEIYIFHLSQLRNEVGYRLGLDGGPGYVADVVLTELHRPSEKPTCNIELC